MMVNFGKILLLFGLFFNLSACSVMAIRKYSPHFKTTRELEQLKSNYNGVVVTGTATTETLLSRTSMDCRGTTFEMPVAPILKNISMKRS